jgi:chromosome segregation ATPase
MRGAGATLGSATARAGADGSAAAADELAAAKRRARELQLVVQQLQSDNRRLSLPLTAQSMVDELLSLAAPSRVDLERVKRFVLEQERVHSLLVSELDQSRRQYAQHESLMDEQTRRESSLAAHVSALEEEKRRLQAHVAQLNDALAVLQRETTTLSHRCELVEADRDRLQVNVNYLTEQVRLQRLKVDELERALLVQHAQTDAFYAAPPDSRASAPQGQQLVVERALHADRVEQSLAAAAARAAGVDVARLQRGAGFQYQKQTQVAYSQEVGQLEAALANAQVEHFNHVH